jgi:hypothetical protein
VTAESQLGADGQRASARVMFKIVIPQTLSLELGETRENGQFLEIGGSIHNVLPWGTGGSEAGRHQVFWSGSGHRSVVRIAGCTLAENSAVAALNCTVSMP